MRMNLLGKYPQWARKIRGNFPRWGFKNSSIAASCCNFSIVCPQAEGTVVALSLEKRLKSSLQTAGFQPPEGWTSGAFPEGRIMKIEDILVPLDFSPGSLLALDYALAMVDPGGEVYSQPRCG